MSTRYLKRFFEPESIVVVGASEGAKSLGGYVLKNLLAAGFPGRLAAVHRSAPATVHGVPCYPRIRALPDASDLAVVCSPPGRVPGDIDALGRAGIKAALILMGGLSQPRNPRLPLLPAFIARPLAGGPLETLRDAARRAALPHDIRIMGPNCMGIQSPARRLNASYAPILPGPGPIAFIGQSAMLGLTMADWAKGRGIGFSQLVTLGDSIDIDIADVIDYVADDRDTRVLLLHLERFPGGRRFLSAVRAAARTKLVIALKSARFPALQDPPEPVPPGLVRVDDVHEAVLLRAGALRIERTDDLVDALLPVSHYRRLPGERLAILSNGAGPGILGADALLRAGGVLADLADGTVARLADLLPPFWNRRNPVDLNADATAERYAAALAAVCADPGVDAILVVLCPTPPAPPGEVAKAVVDVAREARQPIAASWMGAHSVKDARDVFARANVPNFNTPEQAVQAFALIQRFRRAQAALHQTPPPLSADPAPDPAVVWALIGEARRQGRDYLLEEETARALAACGIPVAATRFAGRAADLVGAVSGLPPPFALKVLHAEGCRPFTPDPTAPFHWLGVEHDLQSPEELPAAADRLARKLALRFPDSRPLGYGVQTMRREAGALVLSLGITRDPTFGPLILFGAGGSPSRALADRRIGLAPLNLALARMLIDASDRSRQLAELGGESARIRDALAEVLVRLSQLVIDVPSVRGVDINPLLATRDGLLALSARLDFGDPAETAILPYPESLRETVRLRRSGREVELRPIRGEDEPKHREFAGRLSPEAIRFRAFHAKSHISHWELAQLTQIDYAREMAFVAEGTAPDGGHEILGVVRAWNDPDNVSAEFAIIIRDDLRGEGLGRMLLEKMIAYQTSRGTLQLRGTVLPDNRPMLDLARRMGFLSRFDEQEAVVKLVMDLKPPVEDWQREALGR